MTFANLLRLIVLAVILAKCTGCAAIVEQDPRRCHSEAMTVDAMTECNRRYPQHLGTISDRIAQPLGELERAINRP